MTPPLPPNTARDSRSVALGALVVAAITFIAFFGALGNDFVDLDDPALIVNNTNFRGLAPEQIAWMFSTTLLGHYQPLTWISYATDWTIAGLNPLEYHLTNIVLHAANGALLFLLCLRLFGAGRGDEGRWSLGQLLGAGAGAIFWAVHPLRVESVAWVTERRDVLSTFFLLLTSLAYLRAFARGDARVRSRGWYVASLGLLTASLLSKSWGVSFFVVALVLDWYPLRRLGSAPGAGSSGARRECLIQKVPYAAIGLVFLIVAGFAQRSAGAVRTLTEWPLGARCAQAAYGLVFYPWRSISPTDLSPLYELPEHAEVFGATQIVLYAIVFAGVVSAWLARGRAPWLTSALLVYVIVIAPVLGLMQSGDQYVADRYSYVATIPFGVLVAGAVDGLFRRTRDRADARAPAMGISAACTLVLAVLLWLTTLQVQVWQNPLTLWTHAVGVEPGAAPRVNLALALLHADRRDEAIGQLREAVELRARDGRAWFVLGNTLRDAKDFPGAERAYGEAERTMPLAFQAYDNHALMIEHVRPEEALELYRAAVRDMERPRAGPEAYHHVVHTPYLALGTALLRMGRTEEARAEFEKAARFEDSRAQALAHLAKLGPVR